MRTSRSIWTLDAIATCADVPVTCSFSLSQASVISKCYLRMLASIITGVRDLRLPPRLKLIPPSSGSLRGVQWLDTDVSGLSVPSSRVKVSWTLKMGR